jgi:hypothetical protein
MMYKNSATALAPIDSANLALGKQWLDISAWVLEYAQRMNRAAFETFYAGPLFAAQAALASTAAMRDPRGGVVGRWVGAGETFKLLSHGLPGLVAEYAGDMSEMAAIGDSDAGAKN